MSYQEILKELAEKDKSLVVMTSENLALIRDLPDTMGERFIDTGITEQTLVGASAGLALCGKKPIIHALSAFLTMRAFEFIRTDIGISGAPVKLVGYIPGLLSDGNGPTHQAIEDVSLMRGIPNMEVFAPADENDLCIMLPHIIQSDKPSYIRVNTLPNDFKHDKEFIIGKAEHVRKGQDVNILVYGLLFNEAHDAVKILERKGVSCNLINLRSLKPIDKELIINSISNTNITVTIEDHFKTGGLFSIISEIVIEENLNIDLLPLNLGESWFQTGKLKDIIMHHKFSAEHIAEMIIKKLEQNNE